MRRRDGLPAAGAIVLALAAVLTAQSGPDLVTRYREANGPRILRDFATLLTFPNRARDTADIERAATYIRDQLQAAGVRSELLRENGAPPIVYGALTVPGATRTLGIYVHYDGQPVDPKAWAHPPFEPTLYTAAMEAGGKPRPMPRDGEAIDPEWRLYARSAGDDKAPIAAILTVLHAFREHKIQPTSNLVFFLDGEEEAGSPHLGDYLRLLQLDRANERSDVSRRSGAGRGAPASDGARGLRRDEVPRLTPDIWLFFDGPVHQSGRPQITFGVRGSMGLDVTVYGATRELHSGHYGNWAPDTPQVLARLLASMKDESGKVLVAGWYESADPIGAEERAALAAMPDYDAALKRELGLASTEGQPASLAERLLLPALTVRGISSGNTGALASNVIPATATAALGIRLVKGNDPAKMRELIVRHIERQGFHVVTTDPDQATRLKYPRIAKVTGGTDAAPAARTSMANPFARQVVAAAGRAAERRFGAESLLIAPGMGGTLPLYLFTDLAGKPAVIVPVANHDNNQHGANENLRIANLWYAIDLYAALLTMER
ncbi:MAG TPA: M20/M25/M40 family metallo-hydrolase [Vicinamibacterales bacterium]|nr:M20/M25/M40 family metallo-hydrolase [Vicinamibacterales bacterium]